MTSARALIRLLMRPFMRPLTAAVLLAALIPLLPSGAAAQGRGQPCILDFEARNPSRQPNIFIVRLPSGSRETYAGGGVRYSCRGQGVTLEADSTRFNEDSRILNLVGNVRYREPRATLDADRMTYYLDEEWLIAEGRVNAGLPEGSTMAGSYVEYYRAVPGVRSESRTIATNRPTLRLVQRDSMGGTQPPVTVVATRIESQGETVVYAGGDVVITREDLHATGDSAYLDQSREFGRLMRDPTVTGSGERNYTLSGTVIDFFTSEQRIERVFAMGNGDVTSDELNLKADSIDLRIVEDELDRVYAWGPSRARAVSPQQDMIADSIEALLPSQILREVHAVGSAYAETVPDSARIQSEERDWVRGDTVVARFDPPAESDTTNSPVPREMVATGNASAMYQLPPTGRCVTAPSINYVRGRTLTVRFAESDISTVTVVQADDPVSGVFLEAHADAACLARSEEPTPPADGTGAGSGQGGAR